MALQSLLIMNFNRIPVWVFFVNLFFFAISAKGQETIDTSQDNTIIIDNSDNTIVEKKDNIFIKFLNGNVRIIHQGNFFYCDTAIIRNNDLLAHGNVVILQKDTTTVFADTIRYSADSLKAILSGNVVLQHQGKELFTDELDYDVGRKLAYFENGGIVKQDSTQLRSLRGKYDINNDMLFFKDYVSIVDSSFLLKADSLKYNTLIKKAYFTGPTLINQDSSRIYCEGGFYDIENRNAEFLKKVKYLEKDKEATAQKMNYYDSDQSFVLAGQANYKDSEQDVHADTIRYLRDEDKSILIGNVLVINKTTKIEGTYVIYDNKTGAFVSQGRSVLQDESLIIYADQMDFNEESGTGEANGNIEMIDTSNQTSIFSDYLFSKDEDKSFIAYGDSIYRPMMQKLMDEDTLFVSADTLYSYEQIVAEDTIQILNAYHDVRIFHKTFQGIADSLSYNSLDSTFVLFNAPILWSDSSQFSGDTITISMKHDKISQLYLRPKGLIVNDQGNNFYNQIGAKIIYANFANDSLQNMQTRGNAESLFYMKDDDGAFVGAIRTVCSRMNFIFTDNELSDVKYYKDPVSKMTSIKQELSIPQRLKSFKWLLEMKPTDAIMIRKKKGIIPAGIPAALIENSSISDDEAEDLIINNKKDEIEND